jgi:hypothetical protein
MYILCPNSKFAILCASIVLLVAGCSGKENLAPVDIEEQAFEDLRTDIREVIDDPARETEAIRLVDALEEDLSILRSSITERKSIARELNANYDTTRVEFEAFLARMEAEVRDNRQQVSKTYQAFLATVTVEERSAIAKTHTNAMNTAIKTIQAI